MTDLTIATADELTLILVAGTDDIRDRAVAEIRRREVERCVAVLRGLATVSAAAKPYVSLDYAIQAIRRIA